MCTPTHNTNYAFVLQVKCVLHGKWKNKAVGHVSYLRALAFLKFPRSHATVHAENREQQCCMNK